MKSFKVVINPHRVLRHLMVRSENNYLNLNKPRGIIG